MLFLPIPSNHRVWSRFNFQLRLAHFPALLAPGLYQLVFLERELDRGELYFFAGKKVKPKEVVHAVAVDVVRPAEVVSEPEVIYEEANGVTSIAEIHISVRIFRFRR